ncbi:MAG: c-type cytochrome [Planctomycetes bacterium]|nr:c-type cytochrome [Planctomycetota bacterium]
MSEIDIKALPSDPLTDHEYDGIREFDNPTPGWWYFLFGATVVFSVLYLVFWHFSIGGWTIEESWADDQRVEFKRIFGAVGQLKPDDETILAQMNNPQFMTVAKSAFLGNCTACHGRDGGGLVGVNLTDDSYKNVKKVSDIYRVITEGANGGAMPAWKRALSDNERVILAAYVASLRGTHPATPKAAEGEVIPPWPTQAPKH